MVTEAALGDGCKQRSKAAFLVTDYYVPSSLLTLVHPAVANVWSPRSEFSVDLLHRRQRPSAATTRFRVSVNRSAWPLITCFVWDGSPRKLSMQGTVCVPTASRSRIAASCLLRQSRSLASCHPIRSAGIDRQARTDAAKSSLLQ